MKASALSLSQSALSLQLGMRKLNKAKQADIPAMQDEEATAGKTSSLKLKAQNWNSPAKVERYASRGCFEDEVDCFQPPYLPARSLPSRVLSFVERINSWMFIRKLQRAIPHGAARSAVANPMTNVLTRLSAKRECVRQISRRWLWKRLRGVRRRGIEFDSASENARIYRCLVKRLK